MDPSFDIDGRKEVNLPEFTFMGGISALSDGSIVVATSIGQSQGGSEFNVRKFKSNGSLDPTFGFNGETDINLNESCLATGLAIQSDGKILVGGMAGLGDGEDYSIARLHANGLLDNSFGNNGIAKNLDSSGDHCANTLALQADGKLLIGGFTPYGLATMARYITASANGANENTVFVSELSVSPNPAVGATTMARFTLAENATVHLEIYDMAGHLMSITSRQLQKGPQNEPISVADLPAGVYMLHVRSMEYFSTKAFVKAE
ncbi:MAG: T9SS type A sorting domain-containing protein [Saprospiraceae bacterium]|nr:T9SS type A sorting domain-containing protein [Saprospiraceae bacterium]